MVKLSQKAWNNVLIISMLVLIIIFNSSSNLLNSNTDTEQPTHLLPNNAVIATMDFGDYKIERIGQGWRVLSNTSDESSLITLTQNWLNAEIETSPSDLTISQAQNSQVVIVWLVGEAEPQKFEVFKLADQTLVLSRQHLYQITNIPFSALFLNGVSDA